MKLTRRQLLGASALALLTVPLTSCVRSDGPWARLACGESGGSYLQFGELLAQEIDARGVRLTAVTTQGSAENLRLLARGEVDVALTLADTADAAGDPFVALGRVYQNYLQCVTLAGGHVRHLADLRGRRVSVGAPGSGTATTTRRMFTLLGYDRGYTPVLAAELPLRQALAALRRGDIDAFFWSGGIPTPSLDDTATRTALALVDLTPALGTLERTHPGLYALAVIPQGVYGTSDATPTIGIANLLLAQPSLSDAVVRAVVDTLIESSRSLAPAESLGVQYLTPANLIDSGPVRLHSAARDRYRERYG